MNVSPACRHVYRVRAVPGEAEEGVRIPEAGVTTVVSYIVVP